VAESNINIKQREMADGCLGAPSILPAALKGCLDLDVAFEAAAVNLPAALLLA
jgi:hypothetical protein